MGSDAQSEVAVSHDCADTIFIASLVSDLRTESTLRACTLEQSVRCDGVLNILRLANQDSEHARPAVPGSGTACAWACFAFQRFARNAAAPVLIECQVDRDS